MTLPIRHRLAENMSRIFHVTNVVTKQLTEIENYSDIMLKEREHNGTIVRK